MMLTEMTSLQLILDVAVYTFLFVLGLFIGSFLNVVADRSSREESFTKGRSKCDSCGQVLAPKDLFPLLSFFYLKGKCRYCDNRLSLAYPLSESLTGVAFVLVGIITHITRDVTPYTLLNFSYLLVILSVFIVIMLADTKYSIIPNGSIVVGVVVSVLYYLSFHTLKLVTLYQSLVSNDFGQYLIKVGYFNDFVRDSVLSVGVTFLTAFVIALFFLVLIIITKGRGMGGGDLKLGFLIGLVNGYPYAIVGIFLGFVYGALFSLVLIILRRKTMKDTIPFGPFLVLGSITALLFGFELVRIYKGL